MKKQLRQIIYDMRTQPVIAWVTVFGTAMSIFLIMTMLTMQMLYTMPIAPETHRPRMLYGLYFHMENSGSGNSGSGPLSLKRARQLYNGLEGVEAVSFQNNNPWRTDVKGSTGETFTANVRQSDTGFWDIYDMKLLEGRIFTAEEVEAGTRVALVSESTARRLFGGEPVLGSHFLLSHVDYEVIGVVGDTNPIATWAFGDVFTPIDTREYGNGFWDENFGNVSVALLVKEGVDFDKIRSQVKARYAGIDSELAADGYKTVYHEAPFDQETVSQGMSGSNITPDTSSAELLHGLIYAILLLVPAINLSSMLHSRLRRRISDIGIRRAFGCTRGRIIRDIIAENFLVTLAGGIIGLAAGVVFALLWDGLYTTEYNEAIHPSLTMLLNWRIILRALGACFVLNIISAAVPAWQASRMNPVEAINAKK
ncbi:MAG: ABC transporter permease [Muribaculaceae bacterium]|nr:ABC transporter permease [Muribaculaceae bacterium]